MRTKLAAAALAVALLAGACGSNSAGSGGPYGAGAGSAVPSPSPSAQAGSSDGGGGRYGYGTGSSSPSKDGGGGPVALNLTQANYVFTPGTVKVASGATIEVTNSTTDTPHTFTVTGEGIDVTVDPASSQHVTIGLPAGTYAFQCRFHASLGMKGTLTVR